MLCIALVAPGEQRTHILSRCIVFYLPGSPTWHRLLSDPLPKNQRRPISPSPLFVSIYQQVHIATMLRFRTNGNLQLKFSPALECTSIFFGKKKTFNDSSAAARKKEKAWRKRPDPLFFWFFGNPPTHPTYLAASHTQLCSVEQSSSQPEYGRRP